MDDGQECEPGPRGSSFEPEVPWELGPWGQDGLLQPGQAYGADILLGPWGWACRATWPGVGEAPSQPPVSLSVEGGVAAPPLPRGRPAAPARADPTFPPQLSSPMNPVSSSEDIKPPLGLNGVLKVPAHPSGNMASFTKHICAICGDRSSGEPPGAGRGRG